MTQNEFYKLRQKVIAARDMYRKIRKECGIKGKDTWHSQSIERRARYFTDDCFSIAVVGKLSSGKSTFINALLGCKNLLPTGHDQTTRGITYIEYGVEPEAEIIFSDGRKEVVCGDDLADKIKSCVSVPPKYKKLPINDIDDMILAGWDLNKIWQHHDDIEKRTVSNPINKDLLKDYLLDYKKERIVDEIHIKYPLPEGLEGWRIIDTPGIGAAGGIERRTAALLNDEKENDSRKVDAIIFLQDGSQTLDEKTTKEFVLETLNGMTEADKDRTFFILTHSGAPSFINHKEDNIKTIEENYGDKVGEVKGRKNITYSDGLIHSFLNDYGDIDFVHYDETDAIKWVDDLWDEDERDNIMETLRKAKELLRKNQETINNTTMLKILREWSNFDSVTEMINTFTSDVKHQEWIDFCTQIVLDYTGFINQLKKDRKVLGDSPDIQKINEAINDVEKKRDEYNQLMIKTETGKSRTQIKAEFDFIAGDKRKIQNLDSIPEIRKAARDLFDKVQKTEKNVIKEIEEDLGNIEATTRPSIEEDYVFKSIDLDSLEREATSKSYVTVREEPKKQRSRAKDDVEAKYVKYQNNTKKIREFKALVLKEISKYYDLFIPQLNDKIDKLKESIKDELHIKLEIESKRYKDYRKRLDRHKELLADIDSKIKMVKEAKHIISDEL